MYVEVGWPVRSTQLSNIVLTLQASLENQSLIQGYTVCCRKRLTPGYDCYALTGLMNAMSRFMLIVLPKTKQNIIWILSTLPYGGKFIENNKRKGKPLRYSLSSLRDLLAAKFLPDASKNKCVGVLREAAVGYVLRKIPALGGH